MNKPYIFTVKLFGIQAEGLTYEQPFDCDVVAYAIRSLVGVIKEGGLACLKTLRSTSIANCRDPLLRSLCAEGES